MKKYLVITTTLLLILIPISGCISQNNQQEHTTNSRDNIDPIPHITISNTYLTQPQQNNQTKTTYVLTGEPITFDASKSYDPDGEITKYEWLLDESNTYTTGPTTTYTYQIHTTPPTYPLKSQVILTITDNNGATIYQPIDIAILPTHLTYYLATNTLQQQKPQTQTTEAIKPTLFNKQHTLTYALPEPLYLHNSNWSTTLYLQKPFFSYIHKIEITLKDHNNKIISTQKMKIRLTPFQQQKSILCQGTITQPCELKYIELRIIGITLRKPIQISYGGDTPSGFSISLTT